MRRNRRLVLIDRIIPFLAAFVGLIALAGAIIVQMNADAGRQAVMVELGRVQAELDTVAEQLESLSIPAEDDGTAEALLALQTRINALESAQATAEADAAAAETQAVETADVGQQGDADGPTTDCIPLGTRFMAIPNETYPLCRMTTALRVGAITGDTVDVGGSGTIVENSFGTLAGTKCTIMVFSADAEGFAELRVTCT
ncbi:hypothetical protein [Devosia sp.]|uniref:hypothetical protein n=1 Tax=Devosia sp. TaxID=1871048 RepID=UPI003A8FFD76